MKATLNKKIFLYTITCLFVLLLFIALTPKAFAAGGPPTVTISAATNVGTTTATINGNVVGGSPGPTVTTYWGTTDGGQTPGSWANSSAPTSPAQPQGVVAFYTNITGLNESTLYYFSAKATNGYGTDWPPASFFFTTTGGDVTNPTVSTLSPADNATAVAVDSNLVITFSEAVDTETGNISLYKTAGDVLVQAFNVTTDITGTGTATITANPTDNLLGETAYYVKIDATAFDDAAGNSFAGIADATTWNFTAVSSDATLSNLAISSGSLTPTFASGTTVYTVSVDNNIASIAVTPTPSQANAIITVNGTAVTSGLASGTISMDIGENIITVEVAAEDGETIATYIITVTRAVAVATGGTIQHYIPSVFEKEDKDLTQQQKSEFIAQIKQQLIALITQLIRMLYLQVEQMRG